MSTPPLDPIYCRKCKKQMPSDQQYQKFCPSCGWDQSLRFDAEAEFTKEREAQKERESKDRLDYQARKKRESEEDQKAPTPDAEPIFANASGVAQNPYAMEEYTKQYTTLNWYLAGALIGFFTGPIALALFIYALVQQGALRRRAAELGVNPDDLAKAASARFWGVAAPILSVILKGAAILAVAVGLLIAVAGLGEIRCGNRTASAEHDSRMVAAWRDQEGRTVRVFSADGTGSSYEVTSTDMIRSAEIDWHTKGGVLYSTYTPLRSSSQALVNEVSEKYEFFPGDQTVSMSRGGDGSYIYTKTQRP